MRPLVFSFVLLVSCGSEPAAPAAPAREPVQNVLLISIDTLRGDHVGALGYPRDTTPRIDAFAARGTVFTNAVSSASWTVPAHMTMLTGLSASAHGLYFYPAAGRLAPAVPTLAELLSTAGFRTAAYTGGGFVSAQHGFERGFEQLRSDGRRFEQNLDDALAWLRGVGPEERFFLFVHGFDAHGPYRPKRQYRRTFMPSYRGDYDVTDFVPAAPRPSDRDLEWVISQYDGAIRSADDEVGDFLDTLEREGRLADTLVVITSDHGEEMYEHGSIEHTHSLYDELLNVPLILVGPHVPAGVVEAQVGLVDVTPTILDLTGVVVTTPLQGRPLFPTDPARGALADLDRPLFSVVDYSHYPYRLAAVRTSRWKLLSWSLSGMAEVNLASEPKPKRYTARFVDRHDDWIELFDLEHDPGERENVADRHPDVVRGLLQALEAHLEESRAFEAAPVDSLAEDEAYLEALRALGYAE